MTIIYPYLGGDPAYDRKFNPYSFLYTNGIVTAIIQLFGITIPALAIIIAKRLELNLAATGNRARFIVGVLSILFLVMSIIITSILTIWVVSGGPAHTMKEERVILSRHWNIISFLGSILFLVIGIILFLGDLCLLAFDILDDEYNAIWLTTLLGLVCLGCCLYSFAMFLANPSPERRTPQPDPMDKMV